MPSKKRPLGSNRWLNDTRPRFAQQTFEEQAIGPHWWRDLCAEFIRHQARRGRQPNSQRAYMYELRACGRWLEEHEIESADQLTGALLERWQDDRAAVVRAETQQLAATSLRGLLRWAAAQEPPAVDARLWLRVMSPRKPRPLPRAIPREDLDRILQTLSPKPTDLLRLRTRALFMLIFSSGVRISEGLSLGRGQIRPDGTAVVSQKGASEKLVVCSPAALAAIEDYISVRTDSEPMLFIVHPELERTASSPVKAVQRCWNELCQELHIKRFTSHQVRHSCATELLRNGVDSLIIAKHLGHHGLGTIQRYAEVGLESRRQMLQVLDGRMSESDAEPTEDELERLWLQVRWNTDTGSYTREEMETFARLTGHPDLIREAAMTAREFHAFIVDGGGLWPLPFSVVPQ